LLSSLCVIITLFPSFFSSFSDPFWYLFVHTSFYVNAFCSKANQEKQKNDQEDKEKALVRHMYVLLFYDFLFSLLSSPQVASSLFFKYNESLGPPYHVLVDTNFINFSIQNKLELVQAMMDCLYAKCMLCFLASVALLMNILGIPCITDCVLAELEKLGPQYRIALKYVLYHATPIAMLWVHIISALYHL
jgi:rRNA-processing protein FCF1